MNEFELERAKEICQKASPGPWKIETQYTHYIPQSCGCCSEPDMDDPSHSIVANDGTDVVWNYEHSYPSTEDAQFIAEARALLPKAIKEIEDLRAALDRLARLGNEPNYGNSIGNQIALRALIYETDVQE